MSQARDWKAVGMVKAKRLSEGQSELVPLTQHCTHWLGGSGGAFLITVCVFLLGRRKNFLAGIKTIGTSNLFSYSVSVLAYVSISISRFL